MIITLQLTVGILGFSNSAESFRTTLFADVALRSTAGDDDVEEVEEMVSCSGFPREVLLNENLLTKRSGLGFGDKTGGLLPDLLVVSEINIKIDICIKSNIYSGVR